MLLVAIRSLLWCWVLIISMVTATTILLKWGFHVVPINDLSDGGCSETWNTDGDVLFQPAPKVGLEPKEVLLDAKLSKRDINQLLPTVVYCPDSCVGCNRALKVCTLIPCGHLVHGNCLRIRFKYHNVWCPQCGQKIKSNIHMFGTEKIEGHQKTVEDTTTTVSSSRFSLSPNAFKHILYVLAALI